MVDRTSRSPRAAILRKDKKDKKDNLAFHWEAGDKRTPSVRWRPRT